MKRVFYYESEQDDLVEAKDQKYQLPENYTWLHSSFLYQCASSVLYQIFRAWAYFFLKFGMHITIKNRKLLKEYEDTGYFLFINHTQPVADPFLPSAIVTKKRYYPLCAPSNLSIPVLGRLLPMLGALPIPQTRSGMKELKAAMKSHLEDNQCIVIFPEAHVWPWYTKIRDFPDTSFQFPIDYGVPSFSATVSYQNSKRKKPDIVCTIDGPFYPNNTLKRAARRRDLRQQVYTSMIKNASSSTEYVRYIKKGEEEEMNLLYCGDENVIQGLMLSVLSIRKHVHVPLHIYVLTMTFTWNGKEHKGMDPSQLKILEQTLAASNPGSTIEVIDISALFLKDEPNVNMNTRFTPFCMLRLYADEVEGLPDRILYLDTDVLCRKDPMEFYNQPLEGIEMAGVLDNYGRWFFHRDSVFKLDYLNSGVLLLNMKEIKKTGLFARSRERCMEKEMFMPDQSALNKLYQHVTLWPRAWNEQRKLHDDTVFQHFTTSFRLFPYFHLVSVKPWQTQEVHEVLKLHDYDDLFQELEELKAKEGDSYEG